MRSKFALYAGVALLCLAAQPARAEAVPSPEQLYKMLLKQQEQIKNLEKRAVKAEKELEQTRAALRTYRGAVDQAGSEAAAAKKAAQAARDAARATESKMATKEDLDRTKTELGTQPSRTVVTVPTEKGGFVAFAEALFLKPSHDFTDFAVTNRALGSSSNYQLHTIPLDYETGVRAGGGYKFPGTGTDVRVYFTWVSGASTASVSDPSAQLSPTRYPAIVGGFAVDNATSAYRIRFLVIDGEAGQTIMLNPELGLRFSAGLRYANIKQRWSHTYSGGSAVVPTTVEKDSTFWGIGPRIASAVRWQSRSGIYLGANFGGSLLVGSFNYNYNAPSVNPGGGVPDISLRESHTTQLIPVLDSRLMIGWQGRLSENVQLAAEAGYEFQQWFGITRRSTLEFSPDGFVTKQRDNLGMHGPFVRVKIKFDNLGRVFGM